MDICVNNAGIINWQPVLDSDVEDFERVMDTNVKATFIMSQECAAIMRAGGRGGRIINIGSMLSTLGRAKLHAYCASKSAIVGLTRSLAAELGRDNITANVIAPGYFVSDINASLTSRPGYMEAVSGVTPDGALGRAGGTGRHAHLPCLRRIELRDRAGDPCGWRHRGHLHVPACCLRKPI